MILFQPNSNNFDKMMSVARDNGFGFELMEFSFPYILDDKDTVDRLVGTYAAAPVVALHGVFIDINYSGGDPEVFKVSKKRIEQCAFLACKLNVKKIVLHSCFFPILTPDDPLYGVWAEESAVLLIEIAEKYDIQFCIENVLDISPDIILTMVEQANHPRVKVCFDIGHANLSKTPIPVWIEKLAPHITHVHLSDNNGIYDEHLALGDGNIDFLEADRLFCKYNVKADYTIEVKPFKNVEKSIEFLNRGGMPYVKL